MIKIKLFILGLFLISFPNSLAFGQNSSLTIGINDSFSGFDQIGSNILDAASDKLRVLLFNSLVKKNEKFEYVGDLAKEINLTDSGKTIEFILRNNIRFHNGQLLTSADVKFTLEMLFQIHGYKSSAFYEIKNGVQSPYILGIETPNSQTIHLKLARPSLKNQILSCLVAIPIVPVGSKAGNNPGEEMSRPQVGSGPYKFVKTDDSLNTVELAANNDYWEGRPSIQTLYIKVIKDKDLLRTKLINGEIDLAPLPNLTPDDFNSLAQNKNLKVERFKGANIRYLGFNTQSKPLNNIKVRQAIAYGIDRENIIKQIIYGQGNIAHSILSDQSWAYAAGNIYQYDPTKSKRLLKEAGFKEQKNGMFNMKPIIFLVSSGNASISKYAQIIQSSLVNVGIPVIIESEEGNTLLEKLKLGEFQMSTSQWISGNQDPIFLNDLFASGESPDKKPGGRNRSHYQNKIVDTLLQKAMEEQAPDKAKEIYAKVQALVSLDVPMFPLWYPANIVVANKKVGNIKLNASGDWSFIRNLSILP